MCGRWRKDVGANARGFPAWHRIHAQSYWVAHHSAQSHVEYVLCLRVGDELFSGDIALLVLLVQCPFSHCLSPMLRYDDVCPIPVRLCVAAGVWCVGMAKEVMSYLWFYLREGALAAIGSMCECMGTRAGGDTTYALANGGQYPFHISDNMSVPLSQDFWDALLINGTKWGLQMYEQDWLVQSEN